MGLPEMKFDWDRRPIFLNEDFYENRDGKDFEESCFETVGSGKILSVRFVETRVILQKKYEFKFSLFGTKKKISLEFKAYLFCCSLCV